MLRNHRLRPDPQIQAMGPLVEGRMAKVSRP
jgi:hypothetical protein